MYKEDIKKSILVGLLSGMIALPVISIGKQNGIKGIMYTTAQLLKGANTQYGIYALSVDQDYFKVQIPESLRDVKPSKLESF